MLTAGALATFITSVTGERVIVGVLGIGDVFGDGGLLPPLAPAHPEVRTLVRSRLLTVPPEAVRRLLAEDEQVAGWFLSRLLLRVRAAEHHLARLLPRGVGGRVESILAELAERHGRPVPGGVLVRLPLTQADLAAMVGASRETVNRALADLARRGRVLRSGRGYVLTEPRLPEAGSYSVLCAGPCPRSRVVQLGGSTAVPARSGGPAPRRAVLPLVETGVPDRF